MKKKKLDLTKDKKEFNSIIETILETESMVQIIESNFYNTQMQKIDNSDVDINHLENIFTDETYYLAMKIVPLIERKVLYLSFVENIKLNDICRRLKLSKNEVIKLRSKGINHFVNVNMKMYKILNLKMYNFVQNNFNFYYHHLVKICLLIYMNYH